MNFLNIAILLTATASSVSASSTEAAEKSLLDRKTPLKIKKYSIEDVNNGISNELFTNASFYGRIDGICKSNKEKDKKDCGVSFGDLKSRILSGKTAAIARIAKENSVLPGLLVLFNKIDSNHSLGTWTDVALEAEKQDWEAAFDAVIWMEEFYKRGPIFANNRIAAAKNIRNLETVMSAISPSPRSPTGSTLKEVLGIGRDYKEFIAAFKKLIIVTKLFGNPAETFTPNPDNFISSNDIYGLVASINLPEGRFCVVPIESTLNLKQIMEADSSKTLEQAIAAIKRNFKAFKNKLKSANLTDEMELREMVIEGLFDDDQYGHSPTMEVIETRVKAYERIVEGIIKSLQEGRDRIASDLITKVIKAWMMAKQMVEADGWKDENVKFGVLTNFTVSSKTESENKIDSVINTAVNVVNSLTPKQVNEPEAMTETRSRNNSTASSGSVDTVKTTSSSSSFGDSLKSIFGFKK